jgi:HK97 family phage portal protein
VHLELKVFGRSIALSTKGLTLSPISNSGWGWWPLIREPFQGAWQRNVEIQASTALSYFAVWACYRLITTDIGKLCLYLVEQDDDGVWSPIESPAFSPVLRKPNRYQTINKFIEQWIGSKLLHGNAYILKDRDGRGIVTAMYVLDPTRVTVLVAPDGSVYYELKRDDLSGQSKAAVTVPASEIIHDTYIAPYHPLIGISPIYACGEAAREGLAIQSQSTTFFENSSNPQGILTAPTGITQPQADALQAAWKARASGDIAVLAGELKYQPLSMSAHDAQLIEQLKMTAQQVCSAFGVPPYLVDIGDPPPYANFEPLLLKYHSQCIQSLTTNLEKSLDVGLGLLETIDGKQYGTEFDIDDLLWMDTATRVASAKTGIDGGGLTHNEARWKFYGLGPIAGGDVAFMQQQNWPIQQLAERDMPVPVNTPGQGPAPVESTPQDDEMDQAANFDLQVKAIVEALDAA